MVLVLFRIVFPIFEPYIQGSMFFLGGINSILPYVLYLSLIWVFLIIVFGGRFLHAFREFTPNAYQSDYQAFRQCDNRVIHYYQPAQDKTISHTLTTGIPGTIRHVNPAIPGIPRSRNDLPACFKSLLVPANGFRGPPVPEA